MSVPRPIVRCDNEAARTQLRKDLYAMGFCAGCFSTADIATAAFGKHPYVSIQAGCQDGISDLKEGDARYALVNSPAHLLSYIKRHKLAPGQGDPNDD